MYLSEKSHERGKKRNVQHYVISDDTPLIIHRSDIGTLLPKEKESISKLLILKEKRDRYIIYKNRRYFIGQVRLKNILITIPPPFSNIDFIDFFLFANSGDLLKVDELRGLTKPIKYIKNYDFLQLFAVMMVFFSEKILSTHLSLNYNEKTERLKIIRGRPLFVRDFGKHYSNGITCRHFLLSINNLLNRIVLSGLLAANKYIQDKNWKGRHNQQIFIWRNIADNIFPKIEDFDKAIDSINRLTLHYKDAIAIAKALIYGHSPEFISESFDFKFPILQFYLPSIYEKFLTNFIKGAFEKNQIRVISQKRDYGALRDGVGNKYRRVQTDIEIFKKNVPIIVIDCKYKPYYVDCHSAKIKLPNKHKVSSSDIYQLFFYQARLTNKYKLSTPPIAAIVAPKIGDRDIPDFASRNIMWYAGPKQADVFGLKVFPLPITKIINTLRLTGSCEEAMREAPELREFIKDKIS